MSPKQTKGNGDRELAAMGAVLTALEGLDGDSIQRVLDYVLGRMSLSKPARSAFGVSAAVLGSVESSAEQRQKSIRDLKEEKQPESSNQMAALVAYYLSELAPENEKREAIETADLEKYFKQAGFKLPSALKNTLPNAAASGYFDLAGRGIYRLNPVGYNLVVHGLPRNESRLPTSRPRNRQKTKKTKKNAKR